MDFIHFAKEIITFSDRISEFQALNCHVIAVSTSSQYTHSEWLNTPRNIGGLGNLEIPLLSDQDKVISHHYNVINENTGIPYPGLFIIDGKQIVRQMTVNDFSVARCVDETLRLVAAFKFTDE